MNTAVAPAAVTDTAAKYAVLPLGSILPSETPMQKRRRQHLDQAALKELAASITSSGVLQPILVRPAAKGPGGMTGYYDLVAGERRFLASKLAGLTTIPATIRELSDLQVIEMQVVENNQREGLHELIEAEGFDQLRKPPHNLKAEQIAEKVGRSRRYVFNRLKLCDLCPEAANAFYDGDISATVAFQIARIPSHDTQRAALKALKPRDGDPVPTREAAEYIQQNFMLMLNKAPFDTKDAALCPKAGACGPCPKRTGNQKELFDDIRSADVCTDPKCYAAKVDADIERRLAEARKAGRTVITGAEAKKLLPHEYSRTPAGTVCPDDHDYRDSGRYRSYKEILGKDAPPTTLVVHPVSKQIIECWPEADIKKLLNERRGKLSRNSGSSGGSSASGNGKDQQALQKRLDAELFRQLRAKHSGKPGRLELIDMIEGYHNELTGAEEDLLAKQWPALGTARGWQQFEHIKKKVADKDLPRLQLDIQLLAWIARGDRSLIECCKALRIDPKKVQKDVQAAMKKETATAAGKTTPAAKAKAPAKKKAVAKK